MWKDFLTKETLTRGWHLARHDARADFAEDLFSTDVIALDLNHLIRETISRLRTDTYQPSPLWRVEVPKGPLTFRPGSVLPMGDRIVLSTVVLQLAQDIDKHLPDSVYSWRLKNPFPKTGPIFEESDITSLPFLKSEVISAAVDPWEEWYVLWPEFDTATRRAFEREGFRYLATSDIAAYFENIQLPILRDQLLKNLGEDAVPLVNLLVSILEGWCERTTDGRLHHRGIPQGNFVSSFLGNVFLLPLDKAFESMEKNGEIRYFRYMDDVRIFARSKESARRALLVMARELRKLHLNVQTAKTQIYDEHQGEISRLLIDSRVDALSEVIEAIRQNSKANGPDATQRASYLATLKRIAKREETGGQRILGPQKPLEGLSLRVFMRWTTAHSLLGSDAYVNRLLAEIGKSSDGRLTKKLISTAKRFPRRKGIETAVLSFIRGGQMIFPHQEAESLRAVRYLTTISVDMVAHCVSRVGDRNCDRYLRMQCAYLLTRVQLPMKTLTKLERVFNQEPDPYVQVAMAGVLVQYRSRAKKLVRTLIEHPNNKVRYMGKLFLRMRTDPAFAKKKLRFILDLQAPARICDNMALIHVAASSDDSQILQNLLDAIREPRNKHRIGGVRPILKDVFSRTRQDVSTPEPPGAS